MSENLKYKYYVTEKTDKGIIWNLYYNEEDAKTIKIDHDGKIIKRKGIYKFETI